MNTKLSSHAVANKFLDLAKSQDEALTNMQLQKLVFIAQGYYLAIFSDSLYYHNTRAWQWGPVIPNLYKSLQKYGRNIVNKTIDCDDIVDEKSQAFEVIKGVWNAYGHLNGSDLSALTHQKGTPWDKIWSIDKFSVIPETLIGSHYTALMEQS